MYADVEPCEVCGSPVRLEAREPGDADPGAGPVGPADGVVGDADTTIDRRVCTNPGCPSAGSA